MKIGKNWKIEADSLNVVILKKFKGKREKTGEPYEGWKAQGYFANPKEALHWFIDHKIRETGLEDLETIIKRIDRLHNILSKDVTAPTDSVKV